MGEARMLSCPQQLSSATVLERHRASDRASDSQLDERVREKDIPHGFGAVALSEDCSECSRKIGDC